MMKLLRGCAFLTLLLYCCGADSLLDTLGPVGFLAAGAALGALNLLTRRQAQKKTRAGACAPTRAGRLVRSTMRTRSLYQTKNHNARGESSGWHG